MSIASPFPCLGGTARQAETAFIESCSTDHLVAVRLLPDENQMINIAARDAGLWTIAERLPPGDKLGLTWRFGLNERLCADVVLWSQGPLLSGSDVPSARCDRRASLESSARLALPGFVPRRHEAQPYAFTVPLSPPAFDASVLAETDHQRPGPEPVLRNPVAAASLLLPLRRANRLDIAQALGALAQLGVRMDLTLTLSRFAVDAALLHALEVAHTALCARLYRATSDLSETLRLEIARARVRSWRKARSGLRLAFELAGPDIIEENIATTISRLLFGPGGPTPEPSAAAFDLSSSLPATSPVRPMLMPDPVLMSNLILRAGRTPSQEPAGGVRIGTDAADRPVIVGRADCARHVYLIGAPGVGKSTLLARMIAQDIKAGNGVILVDPHGDLYAQVRDETPGLTAARTILADAGNFANPFGLNLLQVTSEPAAVHRNFIANQLISVFQTVLYRGVSEAHGPMFQAYFRAALLLLMEAEGETATLADFDRVFGEASYRRSLLDRCQDPQVVRFWRNIAVKAGGEAALENVAPYICSKLSQLTGNALLAPIITARQTTVDFAGAMARGEIVLVNLAKGLVGDHESSLLGALITIRIFSAAMARAALPPDQRRPVRVYLDEFATYGTGVLAQMLAECRKFGLELVLAGQSLDQVDGRGDRPDVAHSILANVGTILAFRTGPADARRLADWFGQSISPETLLRLPDQCLVARLLENGVPRSPTRIWTDAAST